MKFCDECELKIPDGMPSFQDEARDGTPMTICARCHTHDSGTTCDYDDCYQCCPHDEYDHGVCMGCGHDFSDDLAAAAYDRAKDIRKYGG